METLADAPALYKLLLDPFFQITEEGQAILIQPEAKNVIRTWQEALKTFQSEFLSQDDFSVTQKNIQKQCGVKGKHLFMPLRVAILGRPQGMELKSLVPLLRVSSLIKRSVQVLEQCDREKQRGSV